MTAERVTYPLILFAAVIGIWLWLRRPAQQVIVQENSYDPTMLGSGVAPITTFVPQTRTPAYLSYNIAGMGLHTRAAQIASERPAKSGCGCHEKRPACGDPNQRLRDAYSGPALIGHPAPS